MLLIACSFFFLAFKLVRAERLESDSYVITFGNFNVTSGEKSSSSYSVTNTVGQVGAGPYGQYGSSTYFVGSGFQYIYHSNAFQFQVSKTLIDLGEIPELTHVTGDHTLTVTTQGAGGYTVYAFAEHPLRQVNGSEKIPDTTCNSSNCSFTFAGVWNNQSIAGFGYNMSGEDIPTDFIDSTYYKSFANSEADQAMQAVMSAQNVTSSRQATVTYKVGIGSNQASGTYQTDIVYVAVPGY